MTIMSLDDDTFETHNTQIYDHLVGKDGDIRSRRVV